MYSEADKFFWVIVYVETLSDRQLKTSLASAMDLNVGCSIVVPFVIHCCYPPHKGRCKGLGDPGFAIDELQYLHDSLEFRLNRAVNFHVNESNEIGLEALIDGQLDLIHPLHPITPEIVEVVDFALPILNVENPGFQVHMRYKAYNISVFYSMQPLVWIMWIISLAIVSLILTVFMRKPFDPGFVHCLLQKGYDLLFRKRYMW